MNPVPPPAVRYDSRISEISPECFQQAFKKIKVYIQDLQFVDIECPILIKMARSWSCLILLCTLSISFFTHRVHATTINGELKFSSNTSTTNSVSDSTEIENMWNDILFSWKHTTFRLLIAAIVLANVVFTISKLFEFFVHRASIKHQSATVIIVIFCESVASLSMFGFLVFSWWLPYWAVCILLNWSVSWSIAASAGLLNAYVIFSPQCEI